MADYIDKYRVDEIIAYHMAHFSPLTSKKDAVTYDALKSLRECVLKVPTADVKEVVRGEWRAYTTNAYIGGKKEFTNRKFYRCSECRYGSIVKSNFCPNCGADMRKE